MPRETTVLPTQDAALLDAAEALLRSPAEVSLTAAGDAVALPSELRQLLADVVRTMRRGQAVTLAPLGQQLTSQQAADLLGVSRPTLVKLLERGDIPYETPSRHRRVRLSDVLAYQERRRQSQREALTALGTESQEFGLYEAPPEAFLEALGEARQKHA